MKWLGGKIVETIAAELRVGPATICPQLSGRFVLSKHKYSRSKRNVIPDSSYSNPNI